MKRMQALYRKAGKRLEKTRLLDHVSETLDCGRRQAKRLMKGKGLPVERPFRIREPEYPERLIRVLEQVWAAAQYPWSVRLKAVLVGWRQWIQRRWSLSAKEQKQLLSISPATIDRRLGPYKKRLGRKIYGQTRPGRWLRQTIPIQTESWNVPEPGWLESDTVSHSGSNASGLFASTLNQVDLFSGWVEMMALLGKKDVDIVAAADKMMREMPFLLKGMDTDCGEEFINYELDRWCRQKKVQRFRSRPYKKDDQAHIEQKNGTHVRRLIGWNRYDTQEAVDAMNDLYRNEWRLLANLFLPSVKLTNKVRIGSKIKRVYDDAKTPLDRLWDSGKGDREKLRELRSLRGRLNPFELAAAVDRKLKVIWNLASHGRVKPAPTDYVPVRKRWDDLVRSADDPSKLFLPHFNSDLARVSRIAWKDNFHGTS